MGEAKNSFICLIKNFFKISKFSKNGSRSNEDGEEGGESHRREVLHQTGIRLPHEQEDRRGGCHHSVEKVEKPNRRFCHASHEEDSAGTSQRYFHQAARGGA